MRRIVFKCSEIMNEHEEIFEFEDDATDEEIQEEYVDWVWLEVGDHYTWYEKDDEDDEE